MSHVFPRTLDRSLPTAVSSEGVWITDAEGRRFLDAAGGAIVVNVGHGDRDVLWAMSEHASRVDYVHATMFTTEDLEAYADELAPRLPMNAPRIYPVSGGSEAVETALKLARAYHLARGDDDRSVIVARRSSYHGNTLGALDASGKAPLRAPYAPWLGRVVHAPAAYDYREPLTAEEHAGALEAAFVRAGRRRVAAFVAEPVSGATLAGVVPPPGYWPAVVDVCRRHGVLLIADEVMTGFGRTGRWFGSEHFDLRPDILTAGKGSSSGYVPFGFAATTGEVFETIGRRGFVHGFTWSHNGLGAAVGRAVLRRLDEGGLIEASEKQGERIRGGLRDALAACAIVGDVRGIGSMVGIELVRDRSTKEPFVRADRVTERVLSAGRDRRVLLYSSTGHLEGGDGDLLMLGPPFVISDEECELAVERTVDAIASVAAEA
jgi:adenosylmethionine-8-amino-7-oxononanoate aminotransferase